MDDSLYGDESTEEKAEPNDSVDEEAAEHQTALIPLSTLGGKAKPGDTVTMKVVKVHGDEVEVEMSTEKDDSGMESADSEDDLGELDKMA